MIILDNVTKNYTSSVVFEKFSLHVEHGEFLFVTGESGSGKSTLIKLLTKETDVTKGRILVDGKDLSKMKRRDVPVYRRNLGIVFQDMKLLEDRTVFENLAFAREVIYGCRKDTSRRVASILNLLGLTRLHKRYPGQLSGGEKQKTVLARALMNDPAILLADEPTGNLDSKISDDVIGLLKMTSEEFRQTIVMITHNPEIAQMADRIVRIEDGRIVA